MYNVDSNQADLPFAPPAHDGCAQYTWGDSMPQKKWQPTEYEQFLAWKFEDLQRKYRPDATNQKLADEAKISPQQWRNWQLLESRIPDDKKLIICKVLGCPLREWTTAYYDPVELVRFREWISHENSRRKRKRNG
jgi:hypothetical protein